MKLTLLLTPLLKLLLLISWKDHWPRNGALNISPDLLRWLLFATFHFVLWNCKYIFLSTRRNAFYLPVCFLLFIVLKKTKLMLCNHAFFVSSITHYSAIVHIFHLSFILYTNTATACLVLYTHVVLISLISLLNLVDDYFNSTRKNVNRIHFWDNCQRVSTFPLLVN